MPLPENYRNQQLALEPWRADPLHRRYHEEQASKRDTAAKRLARAAGLAEVKCACGEVFNAMSDVQRQR